MLDWADIGIVAVNHFIFVALSWRQAIGTDSVFIPTCQFDFISITLSWTVVV